MPPLTRTDPDYVFEHRRQQDWILGLSSQRWQDRVSERCNDLNAGRPNRRVLLLLSDPLELLAAYMACILARCPVFLGHPHWTTQEQTQAIAIAQPHLIWADTNSAVLEAPDSPEQEAGWIMIPTGGTSGQIKFAIHTWDTLSTAVEGMRTFFFQHDRLPIHSCCVLPLYHVSGLMQFMRSLLTGGTLAILPFKTLLQGSSPDPQINAFLDSSLNADFFLSLVPTQLSRLLRQSSLEAVQWISQFHCILLGGAPASPQLLQQARQYHIPLAPTYGMTETGAQVMTLKPEKFLKEELSLGSALPHITVELLPLDAEAGQLQCSGPSVCFGYYPHFNASQKIITDDIATWNDQGGLLLQGRVSRKIISGGENIYPEEIEALLMAMKEIDDVCVFGLPDADWGEIVIGAYVTADHKMSPQALTQHVKASLSAYKCPKIWWRSPLIPRTLQGKVNLKQLKALYSTSICNTRSMNGEVPD